MSDWKKNRQQRQYMWANLLAFTVIFGLFGSIIYLQVRGSLLWRVDDDLYDAHAMVASLEGFVDDQLDLSDSIQSSGGKPGGVYKGHDDEQNGSKRPVIPMRFLIVVRDREGVVQNGFALGRLYWDNTISSVPFSSNNLDMIQSFRLEDGSVYRSLTFTQTDLGGIEYYIQLLSNADGEQGMIDSFLRNLVACTFVCILLSIAASYLLSKQNMMPLMRSWKRQTEFVENASHELRTPLTIIQNKLEALLVTPNATILDKADNIAISLSETRRLSKLTGDLMTLARADSSVPQLQKEWFSLDELVKTLVGPYSELAQARDKTLELALDCPHPISADRERIHELMVILLDNALKYTRENDHISISTRWSQRDSKVVIRVADTGIGIKEESMARIFDRFYREDKARSRELGGTGLGLSIASWIVATHNGSIKAEKNQPVGTVFEVRLPQ